MPALKLLEQNGTMCLKDFSSPLAEHFSLTESEVNEIYASGNGHVFYDRISWALSYLNMAGLLDKPRRGHYKINEYGKSILKTPERVN